MSWHKLHQLTPHCHLRSLFLHPPSPPQPTLQSTRCLRTSLLLVDMNPFNTRSASLQPHLTKATKSNTLTPQSPTAQHPRPRPPTSMVPRGRRSHHGVRMAEGFSRQQRKKVRLRSRPQSCCTGRAARPDLPSPTSISTTNRGAAPPFFNSVNSHAKKSGPEST
jgi:hypothetical protein